MERKIKQTPLLRHGTPVVTWHTYTPWSRWLTNLMARVQSFSPGVWRTVNLSSCIMGHRSLVTGNTEPTDLGECVGPRAKDVPVPQADPGNLRKKFWSEANGFFCFSFSRSSWRQSYASDHSFSITSVLRRVIKI